MVGFCEKPVSELVQGDMQETFKIPEKSVVSVNPQKEFI